MSDFLQFVDRVPTLPNRKKITFDDSSVKYATVEYADEPVTDGTFLNKANFDKLNSVLGYNEATGQWNQTTSTAEFEAEIDLTNFKNNQRLLLQSISQVSAPATDFTVLKNTSTIGNYLREPQGVSLNNGDIMVAGSSSGYQGYYSILTKDGEVKTAPTTNNNIFFRPKMVVLNNGNVMIASTYMSGSTVIAYYSILNQQGTTVKSSQSIGNNYEVTDICKLANGNVIIGSTYNDSSYITIVDQNGTIVKNNTRIWSGYETRLGLLSNNNVMAIALQTGSSTSGYCVILNESGATLTTKSLGNNFKNADIMQLNNDNVMIVSKNNSNANYATIVTQSAEIVKAQESIGINNAKALKMSNGNIFISTIYSAMIINTTGEIVKPVTSISFAKDYQFLFENIDKNIVLIGSDSVSPFAGSIWMGKPLATSAQATINDITIDTFLEKGKFYELVYNSSQNKFIAQEVRN